jgi:radical SAM protein with 4Fe4S-binding SPASM domain
MIVPDHLVLQWHITERCNYRCAHCYQESYSDSELSFADLLNIVEQFKDLLRLLGRERAGKITGRITVTGGEPFVRKDFLDLLNVFHDNRDWFDFAILSNGSLIDQTMAGRLRDLGPAFVQVSLEGTEHTNDRIRGAGSHARAVSALKEMAKEGIYTLLSFTAHRSNYREFEDVARLGCEIGVSRVWADRLIPYGASVSLREQMLSPEETREFFEIMYKAKREGMLGFSRTDIPMHRALQFLLAGGRPYQCGAGYSLITIDAKGDLFPCRRMPVPVGNVLETPLSELYYNSELFCSLRDREKMSEGCEECDFSDKCLGGLKCLSYALTGSPFKADPGCWRAKTARRV